MLHKMQRSKYLGQEDGIIALRSRGDPAAMNPKDYYAITGTRPPTRDKRPQGFEREIRRSKMRPSKLVTLRSFEGLFPAAFGLYAVLGL